MSLARLSLVRRQGSGLRPAALLAAQRRRLAAPPPSGVPPPAAAFPDHVSEGAASSSKLSKAFTSPRISESSFYAPGQPPPNLSAKLGMKTRQFEFQRSAHPKIKRRQVKTFIGSLPSASTAAGAQPKPDPFAELKRRRLEAIEKANLDPSLARAASRMERLERQSDPAAVQSERVAREAQRAEREARGEARRAERAVRREVAPPPRHEHERNAERAARWQEWTMQPPPGRPQRPVADRLDAWDEAAASPTDRLASSRHKMAQLKQRDDEKYAARNGGRAAESDAASRFTFNTQSLDVLPTPTRRPERGPHTSASSTTETIETLEDDKGDSARERPARAPRAVAPAAPGGHILPAAGTRTGVDLFLGLGVRQEIVDGLGQHFPRIPQPTTFQKQLLSNIALGIDVIAQQSTGQGKTLSTLLALLSLERRPMMVAGDKGRATAQATALFVVSSSALARQVMAWAALLVKPEDLTGTIELFDSSSPTSFATGKVPPRIVLATPDALHPENVRHMRALCLKTIVLDEADRIIWPTATASKIKGDVVETVEKMLRSAVVNAPSYTAPHRRKPQFVVLGSTVSPNLMDWLQNTREWVAPNVVVITQGPSDADATTSKPRLTQSGELPTATTYHNPALNRQAHHVVVVAPSGKLRNLSSPPPSQRSLEPVPASEGEVSSSLLGAFVALHRAALAADPSEPSLLVLKDQAAVEDAQRHLARLGLDARPVSAATTTVAMPSPSKPTPPPPSSDDPQPQADEPAPGAPPVAQKPAPAVLLTDVISCRGLDLPSLTTVYTTSGAIATAADYVHVAGRLARLGSATHAARGRIVTLVPGDTKETAEDKAGRLAAMAAWLKKQDDGKTREKKRPGDKAWLALRPEEKALFIAEKFAPVNYELEKVKLALATLTAESEDLPLPSIP